jgi:hypothetical protein
MRCEPVEARVRSVQIVVDSPFFDDLPGAPVAVEQMLVQAGVDPTIAALMINHDIGDELRAIYDRAEYWRERVAAAKLWAAHVARVVT